MVGIGLVRWERWRHCCCCCVPVPGVAGPSVGARAPSGVEPAPGGEEGGGVTTSSAPPVSALYTSGGERAQRPVRAEYGVINPIFFGGEAWFSSYDDWFHDFQQRKSGYEAQGYYGPVPYCVFDGQDNTRIECGQ